jgi:hypothetical protein
VGRYCVVVEVNNISLMTSVCHLYFGNFSIYQTADLVMPEY